MDARTGNSAVTHGPFPIRAGRLLGGIVMAVMGSTMTAFTRMPDMLSCEPAGGTCTFTRAFRDAARFPRAALHGVSVRKSIGSKGAKLGQPLLEVGQGLWPLRTVNEGLAFEFQARVERALGRGESFEVTLRDSPVILVITLTMLAAGVGLVHTALRGTGRYRLQLDAERPELLVTRSFLGIPLWQRRVSTSGVDDVVLEWGRDKDFFHNRHQVGDTQARLVLATADGEHRPLTPALHRGYTLHLRAAAELRAELRCPRLESASARDESEARFFSPVEGFPRTLDPFSAAWIGLCCGSVAGMALYAVAMLTIGGAKGSDPVDSGAMIFGAGGGALAGVALMFRLRRARRPR